jgi:hypothetical protein
MDAWTSLDLRILAMAVVKTCERKALGREKLKTMEYAMMMIIQN